MRTLVSGLAIAGLITAAAPAAAQKTVDGITVPRGNTLEEVHQRQAANDAVTAPVAAAKKAAK